MANFLKEYLTFTSKERSGLIVLVSLVFLVILYLNLDHHNELDDETDLAKFAEEMEALSVESSFSKREKEERSSKYSSENEDAKQLLEQYDFHSFDPNLISDEEWKAMGLQAWQVNGIRKYREKAGDIKSAKAFEKLHVISEDFFKKVEQYLVFESMTNNELKEETNLAKVGSKPALVVELSTASPERLKEIRGIGPAFSKRIVKYRNWLGGFTNMGQLLEVYGLRDSLYAAITPFLTLDTNRISKININTVMIGELKKHPYVKWNIANGIVNYRDQHGPYKTVSEIKRTDLVSDELYRKIAPYFSVSD